MGHPTNIELLDAVRLFLKEAEAVLPARLGFHAKVAGNVLAIVARDLEADPDSAEAQALAPFSGVANVCAGLRDGALDPENRALLAAIREGVLARLGVDNPRYATFERLQERPIA